jgi:hypothetical protein
MRQRIEGRLAKLEQTVMDRQPIKPGIVIFQDLDGRLTVYGVEYPDESAIIEALARNAQRGMDCSRWSPRRTPK